MKWTKEQQEAIKLRDKNMLVAAAAGSGKTAVLVERIKQLILLDKVSINEMLVVTFTNAAASEMKEKIIGAVTKEIESSMGDTTFLRKQLNVIYKSNVSTFHSFALEVIRRYFYVIDIEPNFKICDEAENEILKTEAMEELFENLFKIGDQDFIVFLNKYASSKNEEKVKTIIKRVYAVIQSIPDSFGWLKENIETLRQTKEEFLQGASAKEIKKSLRQNLDLSLKAFKRVENFILEEELPILAEKASMDVLEIETVLENFDDKGLEALLNEISNIQFQRLTVTKAEKESYELIKDKVGKIRDKGKTSVNKIKEAYTVRNLDDYVSDLQMTWKDSKTLEFLLLEYHKLYMEKKREKNLVDFNDIEHFALEILKNEEVAEEYRSKFKHIFVDEYQDSNLLQDTLIASIKRENNLFMVGDVKQSIYKFRLAEPEIFMGKYDQYKSSEGVKDAKIDLNQNFRSKKDIICGVNHLFSKIMDQYDEDAALYQGVGYHGELEYPVELHIVDEQTSEGAELEDEILELKMAELEAHNAVKIIREQIGQKIFDVKQNRERLITKRDIVVLLRATRNYADKFYRIFTQENIPAHVDDSEGYFDTIEIEIVLNLLRVIDNKRQDVPLISLLHSSIFDFSIEELAKIRGEYKRVTYFEAFAAYAEGGKDSLLAGKAKQGILKIEEWQELSRFMPLEDLIWKLLRETGYYNYVGALPGGVQRQANLRLLVDKAIVFQRGSLKGLYGFVCYIDAIKARSIRTGQISLVGENDDVVRIMTIHKSKGLEFPVVLVAGLGKQFNQSKDTAYLDIHKDLGITISCMENSGRYFRKTILQNAIKEKNRSLDMDEEIRILYVAFTRAMDKLILLGTVKNLAGALEKYELADIGEVKGAKCFLDLIAPATLGSQIRVYYHNRDEIIPINSENNSNRREVLDILKGTGTFQETTSEVEMIDQRLGYTYEFTGAIHQKAKLSVTEISRSGKNSEKYKEPLVIPGFRQGKRELTGAEKGTIIHDFMMQLDFKHAGERLEQSEESLVVYVQNRLQELVRARFFTEEEMEVVNPDKIVKFFESPIGVRASKAGELYKEAPFSILKQIGEEEVIVQGIIDCYFKENGEYILIDYKTNQITDAGDPEELNKIKDLYKEQIHIYKEAITLSSGIAVRESFLYLFGADMEMSVS